MIDWTANYGFFLNEQHDMLRKTVRDFAVFTTKRLIVRDAQGITGKKVETYSLPYKEISMWSFETAGMIDAELELWTRAGHIKIKVAKDIDISKVNKLITSAVLG